MWSGRRQYPSAPLRWSLSLMLLVFSLPRCEVTHLSPVGSDVEWSVIKENSSPQHILDSFFSFLASIFSSCFLLSSLYHNSFLFSLCLLVLFNLCFSLTVTLSFFCFSRRAVFSIMIYLSVCQQLHAARGFCHLFYDLLFIYFPLLGFFVIIVCLSYLFLSFFFFWWSEDADI